MLALPCDYASVDVLDILGTNKVNMTKNIVKVRIELAIERDADWPGGLSVLLLCCAFAVLCCAFAVLCCAFVVLCCAVLCRAVLCCDAMRCDLMRCDAVLYCTVLYCTVLYCTVLYCTVLLFAVLPCLPSVRVLVPTFTFLPLYLRAVHVPCTYFTCISCIFVLQLVLVCASCVSFPLSHTSCAYLLYPCITSAPP